jgi:hypothetical protein
MSFMTTSAAIGGETHGLGCGEDAAAPVVGVVVTAALGRQRRRRGVQVVEYLVKFAW